MDLRDAIKRRKVYERQFAQQQVLFFGTIVEVNGTVDVPNTPDHVQVQPYSTGDVVAVYNPGMKAGVGRGVVCGFEAFSTTLQILRFDERSTAGVVPVAHLNIPNHAETHLIDGEDPLAVYENAIWTLLTYTLGLSGPVVNVSSCVYVQAGQVVVFAGEDNYDLSSYVPAAGLALFALIYLNLATNALAVATGSTTVDSPAYIPTPPAVPDNAITSALVRLAGGQNVVAFEDIIPVKDLVFGSSRVRGEFGLKPYYVGTTAQRTTLAGTLGSGDVGTHFFDTDLGVEYVWDGSAWQGGAGGVPPALKVVMNNSFLL